MKKKDAYYFPHDSNATEDPKMMLLIDELGMEGYGIFWMLLEALRNQKGYKYPVKFLKSLCRMKNADKETVSKVINDYELFVVEEDHFFSDSFLKRMKEIDEHRARLAENGRKGGKKTQSQKRNSSKASSGASSGASSKASTPVKQGFKQNSSNAKAIKEKEIKEKEIKEDNKNTLKEEFDFFFNDSNFLETFEEFKNIRKALKAPATPKAEKLILNKLVKFSDKNIKIAIEILERSIENGWKGVFQLNSFNQQQEETPIKRVWKTMEQIDKENGFNQPK
jgi:uncharacterized protein YdaU (DUF1376 family)